METREVAKTSGLGGIAARDFMPLRTYGEWKRKKEKVVKDERKPPPEFVEHPIDHGAGQRWGRNE